MAEREISAREALEDIRAGMDDVTLMKKYRLSRLGLRSLYEELANLGLLDTHRRYAAKPHVTTVRIKELVKDVRSGTSDGDLIKKYNVSSDDLHMIFKKLLDLKALHPDELFGDASLRSRSVLPAELRQMDRYALDFELTIVDAFDLESRGTVRDITERGVGVAGIQATPGDIRTFIVSPDEFLEITPFVFKCECRWSGRQEPEGTSLAGFKITDISPDNLDALQKVVELLIF